MEFFDSHAHYNDEKFNKDRTEILKAIKQEGITNIIIAGYNIESSKKAIMIANEQEGLYATCGISPNDILEIGSVDENIEEIKKLCISSKKVVAVGEIGLDYYWNKENKTLQRQYFQKQIILANELQLPIVIHSRNAQMDTIQILQEIECERKGVFHCCQLNSQLVKSAIQLGYFISLAGACTFKNAKNANEIITQIPLNKLLIETDSPYLSPEPVRGTRNDSRNVKIIAKKIAEVKGKTLAEIANITCQNAKKLFLK